MEFLPVYQWAKRWSRIGVLVTIVILIGLRLSLSEINLSTQLAIALVGLLAGIPHGAIDHLISIPAHPRSRFTAYIVGYIALAVNILGAAMAEARSGRIIIYSACLGRMSGPGNAGGLAPYRISKAGVNALVRNLAHETNHGTRGLLIDAICPNHTRTDMGGPDAALSVEEGADTAIWLATRPFDPTVDKTGFLWEERQIIEW
jgi:NAD(P)-dependent dehydrogenase (short-subunit alcohol dehydrogenase family)